MPTTDPPLGHGATCRSCGQPILWAPHARTGKLAPIDADPVAGGNIILSLGITPPGSATYRIATAAERADPTAVLWVSHYATCPQGPDWAKRKVIPNVSTAVSTESGIPGRPARRE